MSEQPDIRNARSQFHAARIQAYHIERLYALQTTYSARPLPQSDRAMMRGFIERRPSRRTPAASVKAERA